MQTTRKGRIGVDKAKPFSIPKREVWEAYKRVKANQGAAGVDGQSIADFEEDLSNNLYRIWNRMSSGSYHPPPVRRVDIPKGSDRSATRPLGIPTVSDRIAQMVVQRYLESILEPVFHQDSYGYRPGRSAHDALSVARQRCWRYDWVIDLDIKSFFDSIDWSLLMRAVRHHTDCKWVLLYIERWLKAPVRMPDGSLVRREKGSPQGAVVSPILANLFLHYAFDRWMQEHHPGIAFERYADDVICHCKSEAQALRLLADLVARFSTCKLAVHPQKTKIVYCKDDSRHGEYSECSFDFLGFTFQPRRARSRSGKVFTSFLPAVSRKAAIRMRQTMRRWRLHLWNDKPLVVLADHVASVVRGWILYYGRFYRSALYSVLCHLDHYLVRWAKRKYLRLKQHHQRAWQWLMRTRARAPGLFPHWSLPGLAAG
jgi:RNA-directed DNA polymerase